MTSKYPEPYLRVHGSRVSAVIAAISCILTALSYYRTSISQAEVRERGRKGAGSFFCACFWGEGGDISYLYV